MKYLILFLLLLPISFSLSLEYKTLTTSSDNTIISNFENRQIIDFFDALNLSSAKTFIGTRTSREFLNLNNTNLKFLSFRTLLKNHAKRGFLNQNNISLNSYSNHMFLSTNKSIKKLMTRTELKNIYYEFAKKLDLEDSILLFGKTDFDEELYKKYNSGMKNNSVFYQDKPLLKPFESLIFSYTKDFNRYIIIQSPSIEGEIASLKEIYYNKDIYKNKNSLTKISDFDTYEFIHQEKYDDFFNYDTSEYKEILKKAIFGRFNQNNYSVIVDNVPLRLNNLQSLVSNKTILRKNISKTPLVFAGGLWSDINSWKELGSLLSDEGYDVWLIEITGGPGQDCDACINYAFSDLTNKFWPALIGGVQHLTNNTELIYIGHSNGARTAISSLETYNNIGKNNSGQIIINNQTINVSMTKQPIKTLVAAGVPGSFEGQGIAHKIIKIRYDDLEKNLEIINKTHYTFSGLGINAIIPKNLSGLTPKISLNLWTNYFNFINSDKDKQIGNISIKKFMIIKGTKFIIHDGIVTTQDEDKIFENVNSTNKIKKEISAIHFGMGENKKIQNYIREFIK